jgi:hypothetical protein
MKGPLSDKEGNELHSMTNLVEFEYDPLTSRRSFIAERLSPG